MKTLLAAVGMTFLALPAFAQVEGAVACSTIRDANGAIVVDNMTDGGGIRSCVVTPDSVRFRIYEIGLCTEEPTIANYQSVCDAIFSDPSARQVEVSVAGSETTLVPEATFSEGTYSHAIILSAGDFAIKHADRFSEAMVGFGSSTGEYCATRAATAAESDGESYVECSSNPVAASYFTEVIGRFPESPACGGYDANPSGQVNICLLADRSTEAVEGELANFILVIQEFANPVKITANSTEISADMRLTNMMGIEDTYESVGRTGYVSYFLNGVEFAVRAR